MTIEETFEYYSLHYLNQWLNYDRVFCETLSGHDNEAKLFALKKAAGFYRVARNLHSETKEIERYQPVLDIIDSVSPEQFNRDRNEEIVEEIMRIEKMIKNKYEGGSVLSLTTKFLWLKVKQPILIYDSQARKAVESEYGNLADFYKKWQESFGKHKKKLKEACKQLPEIHLYALDQEVGTKKYIKEISSQDWFHERVFDIFLWHKGNSS